ncbi:MAG: efflux RND transporter periplasmic adaptor subunit [Clostridiales bacterium]|nr:efflux RND transporter periplasmic adaptor subunit [Clostridiales bacterium]
MKKIMLRLSNIIIFTLSTMLIVAFLLLSMQNSIIPQVSIDRVRYNAEITEVIEGNGQIVLSNFYEIYAPRALNLDKIYISEGQYVETDVVLFEFDEDGYNIGQKDYMETLNKEIDTYLHQKNILEMELNTLEKKGDHNNENMKSLMESFERTKLLHDNNLITTEEFLANKETYRQNKWTIQNLQDGIKIEMSDCLYQITEIDYMVSLIEDKAITKSKDIQLTTNSTGQFLSNQPIFIDYVSKKNNIDENELLLKYAYLDDGHIEVIIEDKFNRTINFDYRDNRLMIDEISYEVDVLSVKQFEDYYILEIELKDKDVEISRNEMLKFESYFDVLSSIVVSKTSIASIGGLKTGNDCYIYSLENSNGILREYYVVKPIRCNIIAIGDDYVSILPLSRNDIVENSKLNIIDYPDRVYYSNMKVKKK